MTQRTGAGERPAPARPETREKLLVVDRLVKVYGRRRVVDKVSFDVEPGEIVGLLGPNGAGKTTTFLMTVGMVTPESGSIRFRGSDVTRLPMYQRARLGIGYLAQEPSIFRRLTVEENILAILETLKIGRAQRLERLEGLLGELDLGRLRRNRADTLSGGERRRLEITRALVRNPSLILLDEPFAGVDPIAVADVQEIVQKLSRRGIGVLLTDHNVRDTLSITKRAYIIYEGKIIEQGSAKDLIGNQLVRKVYLGDRFDMPGIGISTEEEAGLEATPVSEKKAPPRETTRKPADFTEGVSPDEVRILGSPLFETVRERLKGADERPARADDPPEAPDNRGEKGGGGGGMGKAPPPSPPAKKADRRKKPRPHGRG